MMMNFGTTKHHRPARNTLGALGEIVTHGDLLGATGQA